jgi:hypothetical protein
VIQRRCGAGIGRSVCRTAAKAAGERHRGGEWWAGAGSAAPSSESGFIVSLCGRTAYLGRSYTGGGRRSCFRQPAPRAGACGPRPTRCRRGRAGRPQPPHVLGYERGGRCRAHWGPRPHAVVEGWARGWCGGAAGRSCR